jgi:hypothetical protein
VLGIGLQDSAVALGKDVGRCVREAAHHIVMCALRQWPDAKRRSNASAALAPAVAAGAVSMDPLGVAGWLPSATASFAMAVPYGGEFVVDHAKICSEVEVASLELSEARL